MTFDESEKKHVFPLMAFKSKFRTSTPLLGAGSQQKPRKCQGQGAYKGTTTTFWCTPKTKTFFSCIQLQKSLKLKFQANVGNFAVL